MPVVTASVIQPEVSCTGVRFGGSVSPVVLTCGCVVSNRDVETLATDTGFMECPNCELAYAAKSKQAILASKELTFTHAEAQERRCAYFEKQIRALQEEIDVMFEGGDPILNDNSEEDNDEMEITEEMQFLALSDESSVDDDSWDEGDDFISYETTELARLAKRLKLLKEKRDVLIKRKADKLKAGKKTGAKWANGSYAPRPNSLRAVMLASLSAARMQRSEARVAAREARKAKIGSAQVIHNAAVLGKNVPKKWRNADPNAKKTADQELKERAKKGWLTEQEQEELEEEAQEALKEKRIAEWKKAQGPVPKIQGSVKRIRWALRLFKAAKRTHTISQKVMSLELEETTEAAQLAERWKNRLTAQQERVQNTKTYCNAMVGAIKAKKKFELAIETEKYFTEAELAGEEELAQELEAKRKAEEEEIARQKEERRAARRAAKKEARRKAAEEKGEEFDDEAEVSDDPSDVDEEAPAADAAPAEEAAPAEAEAE